MTAKTPTHPVDLLCCAIATQEGLFAGPGTVPIERNNPGDLRYAGQIGATCPRCGATARTVPSMCDGRDVHAIAKFPTPQQGLAALYRQVWLQVAEGQTVQQIIAQWAPPIENNTTVYLENVLRWTGLPAFARVIDILPPLVRLS